MENSIIWLHEKALSTNHPIFQDFTQSTSVIHIWDNDYLKKRNYSLKKLIFLYETLCSFPVEIIEGNTLKILQSFNVEKIFIPQTPDSHIRAIVERLSTGKTVVEVPETPFCHLNLPKRKDRFFNYWKIAKKQVFLKNGGIPSN